MKRSRKDPGARNRRTLGALWFAAAASIATVRVGAQDPTPTPKPLVQQVRVEVRVLEWQLDNTMDFDFTVLYNGTATDAIIDTIDLTLPASTPLSSAARLFLEGLDTGQGSIDSVVEALETVGKIQTLVNTAIIVTVGEDAANQGKVTSVTEIPYESIAQFGVRLASTTKYRNSGINLTVLVPEIKYDEFVLIDIDASVSDFTGFINIGVNNENDPLRVPVLDNRSIKNQILVKDRSVFVAGLLKSSREIERRRGIPWVSELPFLRWFLSNVDRETKTTELVFLVHPEILEPIKGAP